MQLLVLGSLCGSFLKSKLHPGIINYLSLTLLKHVLRYVPRAAVPGGVVEIRAFNCHNCALESIVLDPAHTKLESFIRCHDVTFAETGAQARLANIENFAVEDVLHMGAQCEVAARIGCKVVDLPPAEVTYFIQPGRAYCVRNPITGCLGILFLNKETGGITLEFEPTPGSDMLAGASLDVLRWQDQLKERGFVMLPMVWRKGACVAWDSRVGCLVEPGQDNQHDGNFSVERMGYVARLGINEHVEISVMDALSGLLPIGQRLLLRLSSHSARPVLRRLPVSLRGDAVSQSALKVHLDSPNTMEPVEGKVYVVCLVRRLQEEDSNPAGSVCETFVVDPWELTYLEDGLRVFDFLLE